MVGGDDCKAGLQVKNKDLYFPLLKILYNLIGKNPQFPFQSVFSILLDFLNKKKYLKFGGGSKNFLEQGFSS